jgi:hypothetical protein
VFIYVYTTGEIRIYEEILGVETFRGSAAAGTVSDGDDIAFICEGTAAEIFVNGTSACTGTLTTILTGTSGRDTGVGDHKANSIELFPRNVSPLLHKDLV